MSPLEYGLRADTESLILIFVSYLFARKKINKKFYFTSSVLFSIASYSVRRLPIHFGVHTIIIMMIYIVIIVFINDIPINKAIFSILSGTIILLICEWINLFVLNDCLKINVEILLNKPLIKTLYFMPSLILFLCIIWLIHMLMNKTKKEGSKNVFN
jgi:hypothetical protein